MLVIPLSGVVCSIIGLEGESKILVVTRNRGIEKLMTFSVPDLKELYHATSGFPEGYGNLLDKPMMSNVCDGFLVYQNKEGSVYVISQLSGDHPRVEVFHLTRSSSILPSRALGLVRRGHSQYVLLMIVGEDDIMTQLRVFEVSVDGGRFRVDRVNNLPPILSRIQADISPYQMCVHEKDRSILFIGGDSSRYSMIAVVPYSSIDSSIATFDSIHCQPLPGAHAVGVEGGYLITSRFGEIFSLPSQGASRLNLVSSGAAAASCLSYRQPNLFLGSLCGDSVLYTMDRNRVSSQQVVVAGTAPVIAIGDIDHSDIVTCVSGIGESASLNRIKISGIGSCRLEWQENGFSGFIPESSFLALNESFLFVSNSYTSRGFGILRSENSTISLVEQSIDLPSGVLGVFDTSPNQALIVSVNGLWLLTWKDKSRIDCKRCWCPSDQATKITCAGFCDESKLVVMGSQRSVFTFNGKMCSEKLLLDESEEISCVSIFRDLMIVGEWGGTVRIFGAGGMLVHAQFTSNRVARDLKYLTQSGLLLIAYSDGTISVLDSKADWRIVQDLETEQVGLLPCGFASGTDGSGSVVITGDRSSLFTIADRRITELVDVQTGTLIGMRNASVSAEGSVWFIDTKGCLSCTVMDKNKKRESHVQKAKLFLDLGLGEESDILSFMYPVAVVEIDQVGVIATGVTWLFPQENQHDDKVLFYDRFQLSKIANFAIPNGFRITCMASLGRSDSLLVGTGNSAKEGKLFLIKSNAAYRNVWSEHSSSMILKSDGTPAGPISTLSVCSEWIILTCLREIFVMKITADSLVHVAEIESDFLCISLDTMGAKQGPVSILVGDVYRSCSLFKFDPENHQIIRIARDLIPAATTATALLGEYALMGDDLGNLYGMKLVHASFERFERVVGVFLGSGISSIRRISPTACWVGNRDGAICLVQLVDPSSSSHLPPKLQAAYKDRDHEEHNSRDTRGIQFEPVFEPQRIAAPSVSQQQQMQSISYNR